ncbi:lysozyme inhibitor LprI family protein [Roseivivax sediminis]|uniref:Uncharacterized conserved protein YecT, DUF1311 family n=1 Tax=Roseivivax sediminis TaxID=936889 RepID=A0A1I1W5N7_9RHOB|nr:lysozyme inhibitor LprI family protein [Roseivivax sediminis]SFD90319.1 Uncharacterized conserved protein YecT, DUF1311 family [Roseivivax sediminis]
MRHLQAAAIGLAALTAGPLTAQDLDCSDPVTQVEMTGCASLDYDAADAALNDAYGRAVSRARSMDTGLDADDVPSETVLREAQRAWIPFRDRACEAESLVYRGGSAQNMVFYMCLTRLTEARTEDLHAFGEGY